MRTETLKFLTICFVALVVAVLIYNVAELYNPPSVAAVCASRSSVTSITEFCKGVINHIEINEFKH